MTDLEYCKNVLYPKYGIKSLNDLSLDDFRKLPLFVEGESKEIRLLDDDKKYGIIYFKPTIYSFTYNRTGIVEGSNSLRVECSKILVEYLKSKGIQHSYLGDYGKDFVLTRIIPEGPTENIEVVIKAFHTGTSKHRYYKMNQSKVRSNHPLYKGMPIRDMDAYPVPIVRFDWRNPFFVEKEGKKVTMADEVLCDDQADWFIDVKEAKKTALKTYYELQDFMGEHNIMIYDLCLFISQDGKTVYGEISPDCGRYRHYDLGSLDKDVWRAGGSSEKVLEKWKLLCDLLKEPVQGYVE